MHETNEDLLRFKLADTDKVESSLTRWLSLRRLRNCEGE